MNDKKVAEGRVKKTIFGRFSADETFDTGLDTEFARQRSLPGTLQIR
ncbi:MAG: hypothetical protein U1E67_07820 [Hyphomicrobiales bacterium]